MEDSGSALEKNVADLTVMDVYDIAAVVGQEFERIIDQYGCEALSRLMPKVVRVLEILEVMVSRSSISPDTEELRLELDRLRLERMDRLEKDKKHRQELERVEDVWRGEAQDLLSQIAQLQEENKHLLSNMPIKDSMNEEDLQRPEGDSESGKERHHRCKAGGKPEHPGILLGLDEGCPHPGDRLHRPTERHRGGRQGSCVGSRVLRQKLSLDRRTHLCLQSRGLGSHAAAVSLRRPQQNPTKDLSVLRGNSLLFPRCCFQGIGGPGGGGTGDLRGAHRLFA
ncbi:RILP-like protein 1 [Menidia menidia]